MSLNTKKCMICRKSNETLYWHLNDENSKTPGEIWAYCCACKRGYSLVEYCHEAGVSLAEFLRSDVDFISATPNQVNSMAWPASFIPLHDPRAARGLAYVEGRGIEAKGDMFYCTEHDAIAFTYFFERTFCGAQKRLLAPWIDPDGKETKMISLSGTRIGLLFYNWNQTPLMGHIRGVVVTEGAFNCLSLQQSLDRFYGGYLKNPWKCIAMSGSAVTQHHSETLAELKQAGLKVVAATDNDEAGLEALVKLKERGSVTHYALVDETKTDWNDKLKLLGMEGLVPYFMGRIRPI